MESRPNTELNHEVVESRGTPGEVYVTLFSGPDAKARAEEYAAGKNAGARAGSHLVHG